MALRLNLKRVLLTALMALGTVASAMPAEDPCPLTSKKSAWSAACFVATDTGRQIRQQYRKKVVFDRKGFATIVIDSPPELVAVNRRGKVVKLKMAHLPRFGFEPGDAGQIVRFVYNIAKAGDARQSKCGYYRVGRFQVVIPPVYDQCDSFGEGTALVCIGCTDHCDSGDCHETDFVGGEGLVINEKNDVIRRFALPAVPLCSYDKDKTNDDKPCRPRPPDPFMQLQ